MTNKVAQLRFDAGRGKWVAEFNGLMLCQSKERSRVLALIAEGRCSKALAFGITDVSEAPAEDMSASRGAVSHYVSNVVPLHSRHVPIEMPQGVSFPVGERFEYLANSVNMVIDGEIPSLVVTGNPGMGKSQTVMEQFEKRNLRNILTLMVDNNEAGEKISENGDYIVIKGYSTAKAMYRKLWENRNRTIVFDDCDKVLEDKTAISILKSALDSYEVRIVTWGAERPFGSDDELPSHFEFKGGIIFITNKSKDQLDKAVKSRCANSNVWMSVDEVIERIEQKKDEVRQVSDISSEYKQEVIDFFKSNIDFIKARCPEINFRTFILACKTRKKHPGAWQQMTLANLIA